MEFPLSFAVWFLVQFQAQIIPFESLSQSWTTHTEVLCNLRHLLRKTALESVGIPLLLCSGAGLPRFLAADISPLCALTVASHGDMLYSYCAHIIMSPIEVRSGERRKAELQDLLP